MQQISLCPFLSLSVCLCPESTDEEVDKLHCLNHSGSSATYSDYSPSQGSSGSSNPPANTHSHTHNHPHKHTPALPAPTKDQVPQTHWTNRYTHTCAYDCSLPVLFLCSCPFNLLHLSSSIKCSICPFLPLSFCFFPSLFLLTQSRSESLIGMFRFLSPFLSAPNRSNLSALFRTFFTPTHSCVEIDFSACEMKCRAE